MNTKIILTWSTGMGVLALLSQPALSASFNCGAMGLTKTEQTICSDATLSALDSKLAPLYSIARNSAGDADKAGIVAAQKAWVAKRNRCPDTGCLTDAYTSRIAELTRVSSAGTGTAAPTGGSAVSASPPALQNMGAQSNATIDSGSYNGFASQFSIKGVWPLMDSLPAISGLACAGWGDHLDATVNMRSAIERTLQWEMIAEHAASYGPGPVKNDKGIFSNVICSATVASYANKQAVDFTIGVANGEVLSVSIAADSNAIRFAVESFAKLAGVPITTFSTTRTRIAEIVDRFNRGEFRKPDPYQPQLDRGALAAVARKCGETCDEIVYGFVTAPVKSRQGTVRLLVRATVSHFHDWYLSGTDQDVFAVFGPAQPDQYGYLTVCIATINGILGCSGERTIEAKNVALWRANMKKAVSDAESADRKKDM
jgi:uncharacterized protein